MVLSRPRFIVSFAQSDLNRSETPGFLGVDLETVSFAHHRLDVYANIGTEEKKEFVSLDQVKE